MPPAVSSSGSTGVSGRTISAPVVANGMVLASASRRGGGGNACGGGVASAGDGMLHDGGAGTKGAECARDAHDRVTGRGGRRLEPLDGHTGHGHVAQTGACSSARPRSGAVGGGLLGRAAAIQDAGEHHLARVPAHEGV